MSLKKEIGFLGIVCVGVGIILGAGIYTLIGEAAAYSGNMLWLSFLITAVLVTFTAMSYSELSSKFPKAGASYTYVHNILGRKLGVLVGVLMVLMGCFASSAVLLGFGGYFLELTGISIVISAVVLMIIVSLINYQGIKLSSRLNIALTLVEALGLVVVIVAGLKYFGNVSLVELSSFGSFGVVSAIGIVFFAYLGFEDMVALSEETKNARKIMPKAIMWSIIISTVLYVLVAISAISVVGFQALAASEAPLALVINTVLSSSWGKVFSLMALVSTFNTVLLMFIAATRIAYSMGKEGDLPKKFGLLDKVKKTPWFAIVVLGILVVILTVTGAIRVLAQVTDIIVLFVFVIINIAVIKLRYSSKKVKGYRMPLNIGRMPVLALLGVVSSAVILVITVLNVVGLV